MEYRTSAEFQKDGYTIKVLKPVRSEKEEQQVRTVKVINIKAILSEIDKDIKQSKCDISPANSLSESDKP